MIIIGFLMVNHIHFGEIIVAYSLNLIGYLFITATESLRGSMTSLKFYGRA
jgi:hypothetical protein